ncbi:MAG: 16S rRNA (guanine(527)-N(7))-methyltransferase RsmG [Roseobacter sp.]
MNQVLEGLNVSRETYEALESFHEIILKWNSRINLVSKSSISDIWNRHIWDSAQLIPFAEVSGKWLDIGSGGGFPGLIVAIFLKQLHPDVEVTLVESDQRKSAFLRTVIRELDLNAVVLTSRVEVIETQRAEVLSARALADLGQLLKYGDQHLSKTGKALFLKGEKWEKEVQMARDVWSFDLCVHKSKTNSAAAILEIKEIERV